MCVEAAVLCQKAQSITSASHAISEDSKALLRERQSLKSGLHPSQRRAELSKQINKSIRKDLRKRHNQLIGDIIEEFKGLKRIGQIRSNGKRNQISSIRGTDGSTVYDKQDIANVFAEFYESLYTSRCVELGDLAFNGVEDLTEDISKITVNELKDNLKCMKTGKSSDKAGVCVEMLQHGPDTLLEIIAELFNTLLFSATEPPQVWKQSIVTVLHNKGDIRCPDNYRPIAMLPILYKLLARTLDSRMKAALDEAQPVDQAGFRKGFGCDDHLFTILQLIERMSEYNCPLWICAIDFRKAFDTVEHPAIWASLTEQGVHHRYISLLRRLYSAQAGQVVLQVESKRFRITRGTKQGDPMSPSLFNSVLESVFRKLKAKWQNRRCGITMGSEEQLSNLRFADDVLLVASSRQHIQSMIQDLLEEASKVGLEMHTGKTKILTNTGAMGKLQVNDHYLEILGEGSGTMYLGRLLSTDNVTKTELENRLQKAWKTFFGHKKHLCERRISLRRRLQLFNSTVTAVMLYGCGTWTLLKDDLRRMQSEQRKMLRMMVGVSRKVLGAQTSQSDCSSNSTAAEDYEEEEEQEEAEEDRLLEDWVSWIQRATHIAEEQMAKANITDWVREQRRRYWDFAGRMARCTDSRWSHVILNWIPNGGFRRAGAPSKRWSTDLEKFCVQEGEAWFVLAQDEDTWSSLTDRFIETLTL